jgi:glycosyltransferase involved in cell wall biosynthesis
MACGVPVIATRSAGPEWVVEPETGQLVDVDDAAALADAIRRLAAGHLTYDAERIRARAVERFGSEHVTSQVGALYDSVMLERH